MEPKDDAAPGSGSPPLKHHPLIGSADSLISAWPMAITELGNAVYFQLHVKPKFGNLMNRTTRYLSLGIKDAEGGFIKKVNI